MHHPNNRTAFTLIELLVVMGIISVISLVTILVLNPAELLRQTRDTQRLSDVSIINTGVGLFQTDVTNGYFGDVQTVYTSLPDSTATTTQGTNCFSLGLPTLPGGWAYHCAASSTLTSINGTGWMPLNFNLISFRTPFSQLPLDPTNTSSTGLYYTYQKGSWEMTAGMESAKYREGGPKDAVSRDGGTYPDLLEVGSNKTLLPVDRIALLAGAPSSTLGQGLVGYWNFDEGSGTTAADSSGSGNTGTLTNGPTWTVGKNGNGLSFDGVNDYVQTGNPGPLGGAAVSTAAWIQTTTTTEKVYFAYGSDQGIGVPEYFRLNVNMSGVTNALGTKTGQGRRSFNAPSLTNGAWHHVVVTKAANDTLTNLKVYMDGVLLSSSVEDTNPTGLWNIGGGAPLIPIAIGADAALGPSSPFTVWLGKIDEVRIYNRVLTPAEVTALYLL